MILITKTSSLDYLGWQLLDQPFIFYVFSSFHSSLPRFPHDVYNSYAVSCASSPLFRPPRSYPRSRSRPRPRPRFRSCPVPAPVPVPILRSFVRLRSCVCVCVFSPARQGDDRMSDVQELTDEERRAFEARPTLLAAAQRCNHYVADDYIPVFVAGVKVRSCFVLSYYQ